MAKTVKKTVRKKKRERKNIEKGQAHIQSTFNNTLVTLTDMSGNALSWSSAGSLGFKGSRKSTPFAAQMAAEEAAKVSEEPEADEFEIEEDLFNEEINDDFVEDAENTEEAVEDFDAEDIEE